MLETLHGPIGGHADHVELVDFPKLTRLGECGTGHAGDFFVEFEEILQRDRGQRLIFFLDLNALFGLDGLMQAIAPLAAFHQSPGELVDNHHFALLHDIGNVELVEVMGLERIVDQMGPLHVAGRVETFDARRLRVARLRECLRRSGGRNALFL